MSFHHNQRIGSYRILRQLGEGGMGSVFEAEHISLARRVAIKILHPSYASDPEALARFFNEAKAVNLIDHPGLVQILDYGNQEDCCAYLVMELLRGTTLRSRLQPKSGGMRVPEVLHIGRQLAAALSAAHGCGIVHREQYAPSRNAVWAFQKRLAATDRLWKQFDGFGELPSVIAPPPNNNPELTLTCLPGRRFYRRAGPSQSRPHPALLGLDRVRVGPGSRGPGPAFAAGASVVQAKLCRVQRAARFIREGAAVHAAIANCAGEALRI